MFIKYLIFLSFFFLNLTLAYYPSFDSLLWVENYNKVLKSPSKIIELDVLDTPKYVIDQLHKKWKKVVGYINVWAIETYRDDFDQFPKDVIWNVYPGWEDERFLDVRKFDKFKNLIIKRLDIAKSKWFDIIEADNIDLYEDTEVVWFYITKQDVEKYLKWLSNEVHKRWMKIWQKNAPELAQDMEPYFDGVLLENPYGRNDFYVIRPIENSLHGFSKEFAFDKYIENWKPVYGIEYTDSIDYNTFLYDVCPILRNMKVESVYKNRNLDDFSLFCED